MNLEAFYTATLDRSLPNISDTIIRKCPVLQKLAESNRLHFVPHAPKICYQWMLSLSIPNKHRTNITAHQFDAFTKQIHALELSAVSILNAHLSSSTSRPTHKPHIRRLKRNEHLFINGNYLLSLILDKRATHRYYTWIVALNCSIAVPSVADASSSKINTPASPHQAPDQDGERAT